MFESDNRVEYILTSPEYPSYHLCRRYIDGGYEICVRDFDEDGNQIDEAFCVMDDVTPASFDRHCEMSAEETRILLADALKEFG